MEQLYYNTEHPASYGGADRLAIAAQRTIATTKDWLRTQRTYRLDKPVRKRYSTRPYKSGAIDQHWQSDLVEMTPYTNVYDGFRYLLTITNFL